MVYKCRRCGEFVSQEEVGDKKNYYHHCKDGKGIGVVEFMGVEFEEEDSKDGEANKDQ
jgi:hypothetical protein